MASPEDVRAIALSLPETSEEALSGHFRVDGKQYAWPWMERADPRLARVPSVDVIAVRVADELKKQALLSMDPRIFFTEPHYDGYPAVLVRLPAIDPDLLSDVLTLAWRGSAPRRLIAATEQPADLG